MEKTYSCAYNVSRSCRLSSKVTTVDCAGDPFKLMKVLLDGLAQNADACFYLTHLTHCPQIVRIFPFDFIYLDPDNNILQAVELPPGVPLPTFHPRAASALILPFSSLSRTGTVDNDQLIICTERELESLLADPPPKTARAAVPEHQAASHSASPPKSSPTPQEPPAFFHPSLSASARSIPHDTTSTVALASIWQLSNSTTAAALLEPAEALESDPATATESIPAIGLIEPSPLETPETAPDSPATPESPFPSNETVTAEPPLVLVPEDPQPADQPLAITEAPVLPLTVAESPLVSSPEDPPPPVNTLPLTPSSEPPSSTDLAIIEAPAASPDESEDLSVPSRHFSFDAELAIRRQKALEARIARSKEAAEKLRLKSAKKAVPAEKKKTQEIPKDNIGTRVIRWLALDEPLPERRKIIRLLLNGLHAYRADMDGAKRYEVRDICPPSFYLRAAEPWKEGDLIQLGFETAGAKEDEQRVRFWTRVVRADDEGFGLEFMLPPGTDFQPWKRVHTKRSDETEAEYIVRELRFCRALGFLQNLSPVASAEISHALLDRLSNKRVASAVAIALMCELALEKTADLGKVHAESEIIMRILESGSWIEEDWIRQLWAGLLASSCTTKGQDRSNLPFIDLLARLTPVHLRIFAYACEKALEAIAAGAKETTLELYSEPAELMEAADTHSFPRIQQTIGHLANYGLLVDVSRPSYVAMSDKAKVRTTPTTLGLKMIARCNGNRS